MIAENINLGDLQAENVRLADEVTVLRLENAELRRRLNAPSRGRLVTIDQLEKDHIEWMLTYCLGNKKLAAEGLGISRRALYRRMDRLKVHYGWRKK